MKRLLLLASIFVAACTPQESFPEESSGAATAAQEYHDQQAEDNLDELRAEQLKEQYYDYLDEQRYSDYIDSLEQRELRIEQLAKQYSDDLDDQRYSDYIDSLEQREPGASENGSVGCPSGCRASKTGCLIKGNISVDTGEKIYHVPGGEFYEATIIRPEYGERWFCTEAEAISNSWRKSER